MLADGTVEKPIKCVSTTFFLTTISILSGSSYDADICEGAITFMASLISHLMLDASPSESISQTLGLGIHVEIFCHTSPSRILLQIKYRPPISKGYPRWQWPSQQDNSEGSATLQELLRCGPKILTSSSRCWPCFQIPQTLIWLTINGTSWNSSDERTSNCGL